MSQLWLALSILAAQAVGLGLFLLAGTVLVALTFGINGLTSIIVFLSETWLLQTVVGAWVALSFQRAAAEADRKLDNMNKSYERKTQATKAVLGLVDQRIYASRRYLSTIETEPKAVASEREHYKLAVARWNEELKTHQVSILLDFDSYFGLEFDHFYSPQFMEIDNLLRHQRLRVENGAQVDPEISTEIKEKLSYLNRSSLVMMRRMLKIAKEERNIMDGNIEVSAENFQHVSTGKILSTLFAHRP